MGLLWAGEVEETSGRDAEAVNKNAMPSLSLPEIAAPEDQFQVPRTPWEKRL